MASSNRHWPSMFKSKHQWQHDALLPASSCHRSSSSSSAAEERAPEPKPRWNPRPEQIRILEAIFNSGMVNPPREEIRRIRAQLQEYGQVGDANVFYWFQNRKSRSKHKLRHLQSQRQQSQRCSNPAAVSLPTSSSSSSSERTSSAKPESPKATAVAELYGEPLVAYLSTLMEGGAGQWGELAAGEPCGELAPGKPEEESAYSTDAAAAGSESIATVVVTTTTTTTTVADSSAITNSMIAGTHQGEDEGGVVGGGGGDVTSMRSLLVFINDVAFEVSADRLDVKAAFGETAVLLHPSGHPVLVDQWGVTLQPLDNGASYYLV